MINTNVNTTIHERPIQEGNERLNEKGEEYQDDMH